MNHVRSLLLASASVAVVVLSASAASAQMAPYGAYNSAYPPQYGSYDSGYSPYGWRGGSYYSYGADRADPGISPNGWDQDNPRDRQLQGTR